MSLYNNEALSWTNNYDIILKFGNPLTNVKRWNLNNLSNIHLWRKKACFWQLERYFVENGLPKLTYYVVKKNFFFINIINIRFGSATTGSSRFNPPPPMATNESKSHVAIKIFFSRIIRLRSNSKTRKSCLGLRYDIHFSCITCLFGQTLFDHSNDINLRPHR